MIAELLRVPRLAGPRDVPVKKWRDGESRTPTYGYRFWRVTDDGALIAPYYTHGAEHVETLDVHPAPCPNGCADSPGPCGGCGITVLPEAHHLEVIRPIMDTHPRVCGQVAAARVRLVPPVHWTPDLIVRPGTETGSGLPIVARRGNPTVPEARAAGVRIEALQLAPRFAHLTDTLTHRYGLPVDISDDLTALAEEEPWPTH
ncbi:hypothetical protein [Nocardia sp. NPDC020380]|uniref:hypothetical protein n=1 Tax=Nocardia sp. NPDC020380 TaxID=3364309 RepID=UPI0037A223D3